MQSNKKPLNFYIYNQNKNNNPVMAPALLTIVTFLVALLAIAFYTLFERKFLAHAQLRKGPGKVGIIGLPQPFADALKLFLKQRVTPTNAN